SIAVLEGHIGKPSEFVRTPKFNINTISDSWKGNKYLRKKLSLNVIIEGMLMLYFAFGMYSAFIVGDQGGDFGLFPFHLMLFIGFGYVFFKSIRAKV
ncbi:MAG: glycosyl transferase family 2, partial [Flavobacteriaceae bacterium]|nr:glycosyl transferase family 2 [Flavobacteriaceae bacterium]